MGSVFWAAGDVLVLAIPILAIFAMGMFGLDERLVNRKRLAGPQRSFCGIDGTGKAILSDPDGKPWRKLPGRQN